MDLAKASTKGQPSCLCDFPDQNTTLVLEGGLVRMFLKHKQYFSHSIPEYLTWSCQSIAEQLKTTVWGDIHECSPKGQDKKDKNHTHPTLED